MAQRPKNASPQKAKKPQPQPRKEPADYSGPGAAASTGDEEIVLDNPGSEMSVAVT